MPVCKHCHAIFNGKGNRPATRAKYCRRCKRKGTTWPTKHSDLKKELEELKS